MKKLSLAIVVGVCSLLPMAAASAAGNNGAGAPPQGQMRPGNMARAPFRDPLNLTADQRKKMQQIMQGQMREMQAVMQDKKLSAEQRRDRLMKMSADRNNQMMAIFTPEQRKAFEKMRNQGMMAGAMRDPLNLTVAQRQKIGQIMQGQTRQMQSVMQDKKLTPAQRSAKLMKMSDDRNNMIMAIFTPQQRKSYEAMRSQGMRNMRMRQGMRPGGMGGAMGAVPHGPAPSHH